MTADALAVQVIAQAGQALLTRRPANRLRSTETQDASLLNLGADSLYVTALSLMYALDGEVILRVPVDKVVAPGATLVVIDRETYPAFERRELDERMGIVIRTQIEYRLTIHLLCPSGAVNLVQRVLWLSDPVSGQAPTPCLLDAPSTRVEKPAEVVKSPRP